RSRLILSTPVEPNANISRLSRALKPERPERRLLPLLNQVEQGGEAETKWPARAVGLHDRDAFLIGPLIERRPLEPEHGGRLVDREQPIGHQVAGAVPRSAAFHYDLDAAKAALQPTGQGSFHAGRHCR